MLCEIFCPFSSTSARDGPRNERKRERRRLSRAKSKGDILKEPGSKKKREPGAKKKKEKELKKKLVTWSHNSTFNFASFPPHPPLPAPRSVSPPLQDDGSLYSARLRGPRCPAPQRLGRCRLALCDCQCRRCRPPLAPLLFFRCCRFRRRRGPFDRVRQRRAQARVFVSRLRRRARRRPRRRVARRCPLLTARGLR